MLIYIVRHAEAHQIGEKGIQCDEDRMLTSRGRRHSQRLGQALGRIGVKPAEIWTSPLPRARETAEELAAGFSPGPAVREFDALAPPGDEEAILERLHRGALTELALVGHEPFLGDLVSRFIHPKGALGIPLSKSSAACLAFEDFEDVQWGRGELTWLLSRQVTKALVEKKRAN